MTSDEAEPSVAAGEFPELDIDIEEEMSVPAVALAAKREEPPAAADAADRQPPPAGAPLAGEDAAVAPGASVPPPSASVPPPGPAAASPSQAPPSPAASPPGASASAPFKRPTVPETPVARASTPPAAPAAKLATSAPSPAASPSLKPTAPSTPSRPAASLPATPSTTGAAASSNAGPTAAVGKPVTAPPRPKLSSQPPGAATLSSVSVPPRPRMASQPSPAPSGAPPAAPTPAAAEHPGATIPGPSQRAPAASPPRSSLPQRPQRSVSPPPAASVAPQDPPPEAQADADVDWEIPAGVAENGAAPRAARSPEKTSADDGPAMSGQAAGEAAAPPPSPIQVMRIIAVGDPVPAAEASYSDEEDLDVYIDDYGDEDIHEELMDDASEAAGDAAIDEAEELGDDDVAPDSVPNAAAEAPASQPPPLDRSRKPPPPPRRLEKVRARRPSDAPRKRGAWWEDIFGEDFARAIAKLTPDQVVREADFIEDSLGVAPGGVMLDLGCGSGTHAVELASRGYAVVGYDLSLFQLSLAADVAQERGQKLNLLQGDMREMAFEDTFDGIYSWNTSFGYFEEEKNVQVAERIFRALRPGGMFLLDVANRDFVTQHQPSSVWFEGDGCVCMDEMRVDFISSRLRVKRSLILDDGRTRECAYSIRLYALHELGKMLHEVGFKVAEASGHPTTPGVFFGQNSPRIIILAQRP